MLENDVATFPITVTVTGDEGASDTVTVNGVDYPYTIDASGEVVIATDGVAGDNTVDVVDDSFGSILSEVLNIPDCSPGTTTTTDPGETTTTTTEDSSSNTEAPPVSVLPTEIDQTELPQTGIDNGPLAALGLTMLIGGAGLLVAVRRNEALESI